MPYRGQPPVLLALIGDSGTGKSTISAGIVETLGAERVTDLCLDDYHKYDRVERQRIGLTALHPDCNYLGLIRQHLMLLRRGETIFKPVYDHSTGAFGKPEVLAPSQFVVVNGLLGLHDDPLASAYHVSIFLDPDPELRVQWKIQRDTSKRGYSVDEVRQQLLDRQPDATRFIMPQRERSDVVIRFYPQPGYWAQRDNSMLNVSLLLRKPLPGSIFADLVSEAAHSARRENFPRAYLRVEESDDANNSMIVEVDGSIPDHMAVAIEERLWERMHRVRHLRPEKMGKFVQNGAVRHSNALALTQLLITYYCICAAESERANLNSVAAAL